MNSFRNTLLTCAGFLCLANGAANAQSATMKFDVASVRPDDAPFKPPSFALSSDASFRDPQGRFHADFALPTYIQFAYKLWLTDEERRDMLAHMPDWVRTQRFDIEATAPLLATKDDYRTMMKALLEERFGLKLHFETKDKPVLAMVLVKENTPGPKLVPHAQGRPCDEKPVPGTFACYTYAAGMQKSGMWLSGSRATTMDLLANFVASLGGTNGETSRRVIDGTGLTGLWDFTLLAPGPVAMPNTPPPEFTVLEALRDQLGIKLKPTHAVVSLPVLDHVEKPADN